MKKMLLAAVLVLPWSAAALAETIPAQDAPGYFGQTATVVGRASVQKMTSGEIYLDLERGSDGGPDSAPVSGYVSRWNAGSFLDIANLEGKLVAVRGEIGSFRYRPEIFLTDPHQIAVIQPPVASETAPAAPRPLWIHIGSRLELMQHRQNHHRP